MTSNDDEQLILALREVVMLLDGVNERQWAFRLRGDLERLEEGDWAAVEHLLSAYGGMGSLNDLHICAENGHTVATTDRDSVNKSLRHLTSEMWKLAKLRTR